MTGIENHYGHAAWYPIICNFTLGQRQALVVGGHTMETVQIICESCKKRPVEVLEQTDDGFYRLCVQCHNRLINYALRPLEFFNLAAIHGHSYYLDDDIYDYETGKATQPKIEVTEIEKYPFPDLEFIKDDIQNVVDFACVQYFTSNEVILLLHNFNKQSVLSYLNFKVDYNRAINYKAYEIAAKVLGLYAADWIRHQWNNRKENELLIFAEAIAKCLPNEEAFENITTEIDKSSERLFTENSSALIHFHSPKTLQWIEQNKGRIVNVSSSWGLLAASSQFDWKTAEEWLIKGRPLSLIALDALNFCTTKTEENVQRYWQQENPDFKLAFLYNSATPQIIAKTITEYLQRDNVPRTRSITKQIINNLFETA